MEARRAVEPHLKFVVDQLKAGQEKESGLDREDPRNGDAGPPGVDRKRYVEAGRQVSGKLSESPRTWLDAQPQQDSNLTYQLERRSASEYV